MKVVLILTFEGAQVCYDIVFLCETWIEKTKTVCNLLPGHKCFSASSIRLSKFGHSSGGIVMYIKDNLKKYLKRVHITNFGIFLVCDKSMLDLQRGFLLAGVYIPPENAKVYG